MARSCTRGNKKFAKIVNGKCIRFGDPNMTIKKHMPGRKKSFCARHKCSQKTDPATPGYQSCLKWNCSVGRRTSGKKSSGRRKKRSGRRRTSRRSSRRRTSRRSGRRRQRTSSRRKNRKSSRRR